VRRGRGGEENGKGREGRGENDLTHPVAKFLAMPLIM